MFFTNNVDFFTTTGAIDSPYSYPAFKLESTNVDTGVPDFDGANTSPMGDEREGLRTLGVDSVAPGGQAGASSRIDNYLGFPTGISGSDLTQRALVQAEKFGAHLTAPCAASSLREQAGHLVVGLADGSEVAGRAVIVATGARYRRLDVDRLADFEGKGVYYAATPIEARECDASPVVVVGGGNSAGQAAMYLAELGSPVTLVIRGPDLNANMSRYLVDRVEAHKRIDVRVDSQIAGLDGDHTLSSVRVAGKGGDTPRECWRVFSRRFLVPSCSRSSAPSRPRSGCQDAPLSTSCDTDVTRAQQSGTAQLTT